jgi:hypothetical protein
VLWAALTRLAPAPPPTSPPQASVDSPHQPTASRFATEGRGATALASHSLRPRPPGSTGSGGGGGGCGSTGSTPHSCGATFGGPLPHPLQLSRKLSTKAGAAGMPLLPEVGSPSVGGGLVVPPGCGSPVPTVPGDGTPGGSFRRRRSYNRVPALAGLHMAHLTLGSDACSSPNSPTSAVALGSSLPFRSGGGGIGVGPPGAAGPHGAAGAGSTMWGGSSGLSSCSTGFTVGSAGSNAGSLAAGGDDAFGAGATFGGALPGGGGGYCGVQASRPSSARSKAVQTLVEAVRSKVRRAGESCRHGRASPPCLHCPPSNTANCSRRPTHELPANPSSPFPQDEATLGSKLEYLAGPSGAVAGINDRHPVTGRTALAEATQLNSLPMARRLLACGASPCVGHVTAGPPLLQAAACGFDDLADLLLDAGGGLCVGGLERVGCCRGDTGGYRMGGKESTGARAGRTRGG